MNTLKESLKANGQISIQAIAEFLDHYVAGTWEMVLEVNLEELQSVFAKAGDRAYGVYILRFMNPVFEQLKDSNFLVKEGFNLSESIEQWGSPEQRERCAWYVIKRADGASIGTLVLQVFHSHTQFNVPLAPRIFALEETEKEEIIDAICSAAEREGKETLPMSWNERRT
jgi:hypothetical protein